MNNGTPFTLGDYQSTVARRHDIELRLGHAREDLKARQLFLTPTGAAWKELGTSEDDRKIVRDKSFAADDTCQTINALIRALETQLSALEASLDSLEAARRADEATVNRLIADALHERFIARNPALTAARTVAAGEALEEAEDELITDELEAVNAGLQQLDRDQPAVIPF